MSSGKLHIEDVSDDEGSILGQVEDDQEDVVLDAAGSSGYRSPDHTGRGRGSRSSEGAGADDGSLDAAPALVGCSSDEETTPTMFEHLQPAPGAPATSPTVPTAYSKAAAKQARGGESKRTSPRAKAGAATTSPTPHSGTGMGAMESTCPKPAAPRLVPIYSDDDDAGGSSEDGSNEGPLFYVYEDDEDQEEAERPTKRPTGEQPPRGRMGYGTAGAGTGEEPRPHPAPAPAPSKANLAAAMPPPPSAESDAESDEPPPLVPDDESEGEPAPRPPKPTPQPDPNMRAASQPPSHPVAAAAGAAPRQQEGLVDSDGDTTPGQASSDEEQQGGDAANPAAAADAAADSAANVTMECLPPGERDYVDPTYARLQREMVRREREKARQEAAKKKAAKLAEKKRVSAFCARRGILLFLCEVGRGCVNGSTQMHACMLAAP
jgi:hypothetical protein